MGIKNDTEILVARCVNLTLKQCVEIEKLQEETGLKFSTQVRVLVNGALQRIKHTKLVITPIAKKETL